MNAALLLLLAAAAAPQPGLRLQATATARILPGERISFEAQTASGGTATARLRQRSRLRRTDENGARSELRLVEFQ